MEDNTFYGQYSKKKAEKKAEELVNTYGGLWQVVDSKGIVVRGISRKKKVLA
jgi:hypothetical protein